MKLNHQSDKHFETINQSGIILWYPENNCRAEWCRARGLFGSQIPVTTAWFELRISCIRSNLWPCSYGNYFACKRFAVQTLLWSMEFVIQINLEHDTIQFEFWLEVELSQHCHLPTGQFYLPGFRTPYRKHLS